MDEVADVDKHSAAISASREVVRVALIRTVAEACSGDRVQRIARLLECEPAEACGSPEVVGSWLAGFRVDASRKPALLTLAGHHRCSRYALLLRLETRDGMTWCRAETRAHFPGWRGRLYRAAVLGTGAHRHVVTRMLRALNDLAEQASDSDVFREREESLWRAETRFDHTCMARVLPPEFVEFGRSGRVRTREQTLAVEPVALDVQLRDFAVHQVADGVVLVNYLSVARSGDQALTGRRSSLWVREGDVWLLRFHRGTPC